MIKRLTLGDLRWNFLSLHLEICTILYGTSTRNCKVPPLGHF